jgi:hypothetical protein
LKSSIALAFLFVDNSGSWAQDNKIAKAKDHVGDRATVCGKVASTHYAKSSKGEPTFLNLDEPYPKEVSQF